MITLRFAALATLTFLTAGSPATAAELSIPGTGDGIEMLRAVAAAYTSDNPRTAIVVPPSTGSGGGVISVAQDKAVLGRIAVPLSASEEAAGLSSVAIFRLPAAIYAHPSAGVSSLSSKQLAGIYQGAVKNWKEVGGADVRIKVIRREDKDSTLVVLRASMPGWSDLEITERSKMTYTTQENMDALLQTEGSIGFGPYSKAAAHSLAVLKIDGLQPSEPNYPSFNRIRLIYKDTTITPEAKDFLAFATSKKANDLYANFGGVAEVPNSR
jgi:phosphate transport system substrate-binding protein